jgi:hypothetical protein
VARRLAHEPFGWRPATLLIRVRRYRCSACRRVWPVVDARDGRDHDLRYHRRRQDRVGPGLASGTEWLTAEQSGSDSKPSFGYNGMARKP